MYMHVCLVLFMGSWIFFVGCWYWVTLVVMIKANEASFPILSRLNDFSYNLLHFMSIANYPTSCTTTSPPTNGDNEASGYSMVASWLMKLNRLNYWIVFLMNMLFIKNEIFYNLLLNMSILVSIYILCVNHNWVNLTL